MPSVFQCSGSGKTLPRAFEFSMYGDRLGLVGYQILVGMQMTVDLQEPNLDSVWQHLPGD